MIDKSISKERVARWRERLTDRGYRSVTVFLSAETLAMLAHLRGHFHAKRKTSQLISIAIKTLYETVHKRAKH